jgi:hypothetical protein
MRAGNWVLTAVAATAAVAVIASLATEGPRDEVKLTTSRPAATIEPSTIPQASPSAGLSSLSGPAPAAAEPKPSLEKEFADSRDYLAFAQSTHAKAVAGDPVAQYYLAEALSFCASGYSTYFDRGNKRRTLDEALQWASTRLGGGASLDEVNDIYTRCQSLQDAGSQQFGQPAEWLAKSSDAGFPKAQAKSAGNLYSEAIRASLGAMSSGSARELRARADELVEQAISSKDPAVLWAVADMQAAITSDVSAAEKLQWVWRLAACQRGYDCSPTASWHEFMCRYDYLCRPGEDGVELIRRATQHEFSEVERQAREFNEKLDRGAVSELNLRSENK